MKFSVEFAKEVTEKIDSTLLKPTAVSADIEKLCKDAVEYGFKAVCVNPINVPACKAALKDTPVKVCTVVGFPLGEELTKVKLFALKKALKAGADEIDMVMCISAAKMGRWDYVGKEIKKLARAAGKAVLKVIIEACYLTQDEIKTACEVAVKNGARFVKTSTGYGTSGAKAEDVTLIHNAVTATLKTDKPDVLRCEVKAAGGIKTYEQAKAMVEAGATRIGTSNGVGIAIEGAEATKAMVAGAITEKEEETAVTEEVVSEEPAAAEDTAETVDAAAEPVFAELDKE